MLFIGMQAQATAAMSRNVILLGGAAIWAQEPPPLLFIPLCSESGGRLPLLADQSWIGGRGAS